MRVSSATFGFLGSCLVLVGVLSILAGVPQASRDLAPVTGPGDLVARAADFALPLSAAAAALVAMVVSLLVAANGLRFRAAALELLVLGVAIEVSLIAAAGRIGYETNGSVVVAAVLCLCGGASVVVAAFGAAGARD